MLGGNIKVMGSNIYDEKKRVINCESAEKCGYHAIQWDVDSLDWKNYGVDSILTTVLNQTF